MVMLLLTFFIMLMSISKIDAVQFEQVKAGLTESISKKETERPLERLKKDMKEVLTALEIDRVANVGQDSLGIVVEFASIVFYDFGSATVKPAALPVLQQPAEVLNNQRYNTFQIEVQGHTDDAPIHTPQFPSNWELSAARATGVVRSLIGFGVFADRMRALGFADITPKVSNRAPDGTPLLQNQVINRPPRFLPFTRCAPAPWQESDRVSPRRNW